MANNKTPPLDTISVEELAGKFDSPPAPHNPILNSSRYFLGREVNRRSRKYELDAMAYRESELRKIR